MSIADSPIATASAPPPAEIPGPEDWFVWPEESASSPTTAVRICFRSWLSPGTTTRSRYCPGRWVPWDCPLCYLDLFCCSTCAGPPVPMPR